MSRLIERIENYNKAFKLFSDMREFYIREVNDMTKLALVQSFEITIELGWKILKDYMEMKGIKALTPKEAVKEAFAADVIYNGQVWIDMIKDRNMSSPEYNIDKTDKILEKISTVYFKELSRFSRWTGELNG